MDEQKLFAVVIGNPFKGGLAVHGPFTQEGMEAFVRREAMYNDGKSWWAVPMQQDV